MGVLIPGSMADLTQKDNYTDENGEKATIPEGFTISRIPEESNVSDGLVIYDIPESEVENVDWSKKTEYGNYEVKTKYNQYVWIPCTVNQDENKLQYNCNVAINTVKDILGNAIKKSGEIKLLNTGVTTQQSNIYDMTGNVAEQTTESNPLESVQEFKIVRGNSFRGESASGSRADHTMKSEYHNICDFVGFRSTIFIK